MSKNEITSTDAALLLEKLMSESIPVAVFFVSTEGVQVKLLGFLDSATNEAGLTFCTLQGAPAGNSYLAVLLGNPIGTGCKFAYGDKRELPEAKREAWAGALGDSVLTISLLTGARLSIFFNP